MSGVPVELTDEGNEKFNLITRNLQVRIFWNK